MPLGGREEESGHTTIVDSSVLINFLGLGRLDLLTSLPNRALRIVPEVTSEIQRNRTALEAAVQTGDVRQVESMIASDLALFANLTLRISAADASCIIAAKALGADLAVDDRVFRQLAATELTELSEQRLTGTGWLLVEAVQAGLITMEEGDRVLNDFVTVKYRPKVQSLKDLEP